MNAGRLHAPRHSPVKQEPEQETNSDVPRLTETHIHECLEARTDQLPQLRELGPPDLIELIKQGPGKSAKQVSNQQDTVHRFTSNIIKTGFYHNATGVDASSSASLAAYINTLTYTAFDTKTTKIVEGTYCCYNAFSRLDMRVEVTIPGTVESYAVDERGQKRSATDDMWLETYLCSVLRAYSYSDDGSGDIIRKIMGVRRFNPVTTTETEHRFLQAAEELFFRGWQLGSDSLVQVPNNVCNHLCTGLLKYFRATGRFSSGINLFEKLRAKNIEVSSLLAKVMIMGNEEVQAVRVLQDALKETPMDYVLLDTQCAFLKDKALHSSKPELKEERLSWALACADRATIAAPSEFNTWAKLCEIYVAQEDWGNALVTLNSCPMFTYQDKDAPVFPEPREVHLPTLAEAKLDEIESDSARDDYHIHPTLQNLRANAYKGTFKKAYELLTLMSNHVGWDQLLKIRSNVFVMEEEYRHERQPSVAEKSSPSVDVLRGTPDGRSKEGGSTNGDNDSPESATESTPSNKSDPVDHALDTAHAGDAGDVAAANLEVPSETVDKEGVKAGNEDVSFLPQLMNLRVCLLT